MRNTLIIFSFLFIFAHSLSLSAQKTKIYTPPEKTYSDAIQVFQQENYGAAEQLFEQVIQQVNDPANIMSENASYYATLSAVYIGEKSAIKKIEYFVTDYPESAWLPSVYFEQGKLYFKTRKYEKSLISLREVKAGNLSKDQQSEYHYLKGYSEMQLEDTDAALASFAKVADDSKEFAGPAKYYSAHINYNNGNYDAALSGFKALENNRKYKKYIPKYLLHIYYELGDYQRVVREGPELMTKADSKTKGELSGLIANAYYNLDNYLKAYDYFDLYERTVRKEISPAEQYRIGYTKFVSEKYESAIYNFQEASKGDASFNQNAWYHLGFCYLKSDELKFAQSAFLKAYNLNGEEQIKIDALYNYVKVTIELGNDLFNDPVEIVQSFIDRNPNLERIDEAYDLLAQLYLTSRKYDAALSSIEKTRNPNKRLQGVYQQIAFSQGTDYFNRGTYEKAIIYFEKSLLYTPDTKVQAMSVFWQADALYRLKRYGESVRKYNDFLALKGAKESGLYATCFYNIGYAYFNQRNYSSAELFFNKFLREDDTSIKLVNDAKLRLADSYFITKQYNQAMTWYDQVINNGNGQVDYAIYQKAFCYGAQGEFEKKINTLQELVKKHQKSPLYDDALYEIASTSLTLKDQRMAITYFDKLVKERPNSSLSKKGLIKMGFIYYNSNQYDQAIRTLKKVIDTYPASLEATEALNTLKNVYIDIGKVDQYFAYAKNLDFVQVSTSEEDSLTFVSGENYYLNRDCGNAIPSFKKYLTKFPTGGFVLSTYNYLSNCYEEIAEQDSAMAYYKKIIDFPNSQYTDKALLKAARYEFDKKHYPEAKAYYEKLNSFAQDQGMILEARDGSMRCAYLLGDFRTALKYALQLMDTPEASEEQLLFANYVAARSNLNLNNISEAEKYFESTTEMTSFEMGAESLYELAVISFNKNQLDESENRIYGLPEKYPEYEYWIAKGFILLADIYLVRENPFQAEQTLQSVIDNYQGEDLKEVAQQKLNDIRPETNNEGGENE